MFVTNIFVVNLLSMIHVFLCGFWSNSQLKFSHYF